MKESKIEGWIETSQYEDKISIIYLEDNENDYVLVEALLCKSSLDYQVIRVKSREEYLKQLKPGRFDIILSDYMLTAYCGMEAFADARKTVPEIPFILITADLEKEQAIEYTKRGIAGYVSKNNLEGLEPAIEHALKVSGEQKKAFELETRREQERIRMDQMLRQSPSILYAFTLDNRFTQSFISDNVIDILGYRVDEWHDKDYDVWKDLVHVDDIESVLEASQACIRYKMPGSVEYRIRRADGQYIWIYDTFRVVKGPQGYGDEIVGCMTDTTERRKLQEALQFQVRHDMLTGLPNRTELSNRVRTVLTNHGNLEHSLCFLELDNFRIINETYGHDVGDEYLCAVVEILLNNIRDQDVVGRFGSDEFVILLENCSLSQATRASDEILAAIRKLKFNWQGNIIKATASAGLISTGKQQHGEEELIRFGQHAAALAKEKGGDRHYLFNEKDESIWRRTQDIENFNLFNSIIDENRIRIFAQPIVPLNGEVGTTHVEILMRYLDDQGKLCPPVKLINAAERFHISIKLDKHIIQKVTQILNNNSENISHINKVGINLSGQSVSDPDFLDFIVELLMRCNLPLEMFCFEITETTAINNLQQARKLVQILRGMGCTIALDDFGTGMSTFHYLRNFEADFVKIDGSFVKNISTSSIDYVLVKSMHEGISALGKKSIAESAEDQEVVDLLREIGVDYVQGYITGKPSPLEEHLKYSQGLQDSQNFRETWQKS